MKKFLAMMLLLGMTLFMGTAWANNIAVSNVSITSQNSQGSTTTANINFNITWNNSWRNSVNYDAAWVFVKYSTDGGITWAHATLSATGGTTVSDGGTGGILNPTGYSVGSGTALQIIVPTESTSGYKGAFLQRAANGAGTVTTSNVQLVWNWGANGLLASTTARVQVYAIEMVYVPTGSFYVGDGTSTSVTGQFCAGSNHTTPLQIISQGSLTLGGGAGSLGNNNTSGMNTADDFNDGTSKTLPAAFPEGYNAFYMMKYDISQGQWRDFLNTLTRTQQNSLIYQGGNGPNYTGVSSISLNVFAWANSTSAQSRNGVEITAISSSSAPMTFSCNLNGTVNGSNDGEWIAMNYLSWMDGAAYAAWAGLRPYTELEFEKAARGPSSVDTGVNGEYAWGTATYTAATGTNGGGTNVETPSNAGANVALGNSGTGGPMRVGSFAASSTTRVQAGASYWGIMDLSGNVWKRPVTVGNTTGRAFTGSNGTGVLATDGNATNSDWPGYSAGEVSGATGCGFRGGTWSTGSTSERVSDRSYAVYADTSRYYDGGARFARTSP